MSFSKVFRYVGFTSLVSFVVALPLAASVQVVGVTDDFSAIATAIGGPHVTVNSLIKGSRDLHHINPKPSMVMKARKADLIIRIGMSQDGWVDSVIQASRNRRISEGQAGYLDASGPIRKLEVPTGKIDGGMGDVHREGNPHYWLNPMNGIIIARQIRDRLSKIDPDHSADYQKNFRRFRGEILARMPIWKSKLDRIRSAQIVTYHSTWAYFFDGFGLRSRGELESLPGIPPTARHLAKLRTALLATPSKKIVLSASFHNIGVAKTFAQRVDAKLVVTPANVGTDGISTYVGLFDTIVTRLTN